MCEVPLNAMFGHSTDSARPPRARAPSPWVARYAIVPKQEQDEMKKVYRERLAAGAAKK